MQMPPKISVCIPTYNSEKYLKQALDSVLSQSFKDFEIVVVDNNSKDNTAVIAEYYSSIDSRIVFYRNEENIGMVGNWNLCLKQASGEYIKFVFSDDVLLSEYALEKMFGVLEEDPDVSLVACARFLINDESDIIRKVSFFDDNLKCTGEEIINRSLFLQTNIVGEPTAVMFRRKPVGCYFDYDYKQIVDFEMWIRLLECGSFAYIAEPLCGFRVHSEQQTTRNRKSLVALEDWIKLYDCYFNKPYININSMVRFFVRFDNTYSVFKMCLFGKMSIYEFFFYYPIHAFVKPFYKIYKKYVLSIVYK